MSYQIKIDFVEQFYYRRLNQLDDLIAMTFATFGFEAFIIPKRLKV